MRAVRLDPPGRPQDLRVVSIEDPVVGSGTTVVRVRAASITRDELSWAADRLPAIPSYEMAGEVAASDPAGRGPGTGQRVCGLLPFDRDGAAAELAVVPTDALGEIPSGLSWVRAAALPLAALSAWQGLFVHGALQPSQRVLILGAAGGVGHLAVQLAAHRGAHVVAVASGAGVAFARALGAEEAFDRHEPFEDAVAPVDLVFDTSASEALVAAATLIRPGGRLVSIAADPPAEIAARLDTSYFVVEPDPGQLEEILGLAAAGVLRPAIDSTFPLSEAARAFERVATAGTRGKVVLEVEP